MKKIIRKCTVFALILSMLQSSAAAVHAEEPDQPQEIPAEEVPAYVSAEVIAKEPEMPEHIQNIYDQMFPKEDSQPEQNTFKEKPDREPDADIMKNDISTAIPLTLDKSASVKIETGGDYTWFSFKPSETARYALESLGDADPYVLLYDSDLNYIGEDDDTGSGYNFTLNRKLEKGRTYYYKVFMFSEYSTATFNVRLFRDNMLTVTKSGSDTIFVKYNGSVNLKIFADADIRDGMTYEWYRADYSGTDYDGSLVATGTTQYTASGIKDVNYVYCIVKDKFGNQEHAWYTIQVDNGFSAMTDVPVWFLPDEGYKAVLKVYAKANDKSGMIYYWFFNQPDEYGGYYPVEIEGENKDTYTTPALTESCGYTCSVRDKYHNRADIVFTITAYKRNADMIMHDTVFYVPYKGTYIQVCYGSASQIWESDSPEIASVDNYGVVTGHENGVARISYRNEDSSLLANSWAVVMFKDVEDQSKYFFEPVYWALGYGITVGAGGPGKFSPNSPCTREQIVTFLWRMEGEPDPAYYTEFTDVKSTDWYYKPINWAASYGITVGLNDGTGRFGVGMPCTREMCVTFLYRDAYVPNAAKYKLFTDVGQDRYYFDPISWAAEKGITVGLNDGTGRFGVGQTCTRAMIVTFLYRFYNS